MNNNAKMLSLATLFVLMTLQQAFAGTAAARLTDIDGDSVIIAICLAAGLLVLLRREFNKNRR